MESTKPSLYRFDDYREYLKEYFDYLRSRDSKFSLRAFSRKADIGSPSYIQSVIDGKRRIGKKTVEKLVKALELKALAADYFEALVFYNQAQTLEEASRHESVIRSIRSKRQVRAFSSNYTTLLDEWYYLAVRELIGFADFKEDPVWIANQLEPKIRPDQAERAIEILLETQAIKRDKNGKLVQTDPMLETPQTVHDLSVLNYYKQMFGLGLRSLESLEAKERDLGGLTLGTDESDFQAIQKDIQDFRAQLLKKYGQKSSKNDRIYQINLQVFPLANLSDKKAKS